MMTSARCRTGGSIAVRFCLLFIAFVLPMTGVTAAEVRVAAASSLQFSLPEIIAGYEIASGDRVRVSYGSSGLLSRQISRGAPFDLFLSANEGYVEILVRAGLTRDEGAVYAVGRLVLFIPHGSPLDPGIALERLPGEVTAGHLKHFALAHPDHAPYGIAAREALERSGAWVGIVPARVIGESVTQAARFLISGGADAGLIAHSLVLQPQVGKHGRYRLIDEELYSPLRQRMVLMRGSRPEAAAFYDYLRGPEAGAVFARHGFSVPE